MTLPLYNTAMKLLYLILGAFLLSHVFAELPQIRIISPLEEDPIIAYQEISIFGELKKADKLSVNGYPVDLQDGMFRIKFKFSEPGYRLFTFKAENESGRIEKKLKVASLLTWPDLKGEDYQREVELLTTLKYISSYMGTDFFKPRIYMRRGDICRVLLLLKDINPASGYSNSYHFTDLLPSNYAYPYVQLALNNGLIYPINANEFGPQRILTREEAVSILKKFYKPGKEEFKGYFKDLSVDNSDHRWICYMASHGLLPPSWIADDNFYLTKPVTRAEFAFLLSRIEKISAKIKEQFGIDLPLYKKNNLTQTTDADSTSTFSFRPLSENIFAVECSPDKSHKTLFVEFKIKSDRFKNGLLLVDDGQGVDVIAGDNIFSGVLNMDHVTDKQMRFYYKLFDEYNLIYKVGEGNLHYENGALTVI